MRLRYLATLSFAFALVISAASTAQAQTSGWGALSISAARIDYDLSGTGSAPGFAIRTTRDLSPNVALEFGGVFAKLEQPLGTSPLFMPEAHIRYRWNLGRFSPYMSGGMGASLVTSPFHSDWDRRCRSREERVCGSRTGSRSLENFASAVTSSISPGPLPTFPPGWRGGFPLSDF
jgi:hypothetical protein